MLGPEDSGRVLEVGDAEARALIREDLDRSLLVEAAAGTGKTTVLVSRLVSILESGKAEVGGMVAVTFTRKAAGELKLRLRQALDRRLQELEKDPSANEPSATKSSATKSSATEPSPEVRPIERAIERLEEAHIGTIHSFCAEILRERPVEAGIDPAFEGLSETEAPALFHRAFQGWIQHTLEEMPEGVRRALGRIATQSAPFSTPLESLESAGWRLAEWRDFPARWQRPPFERDSKIDTVVAELTRLAAMVSSCSDPRDILRRDLESVVSLSGWIERSERIGPRDYDVLEARLLARPSPLTNFKRQGRGAFADGVTRGAVLEARECLRGLLEELRALADADLAALLQGELSTLLERYEALKKEAGTLDFVDLLIRARDLLRDHPEVRRHLQSRFSHIFVDEFQDTDPLQVELLMLLAADDAEERDWRLTRPVRGKLFLVGDPKQSIYRFRRADVSMYQEVKEQLLRQGVSLVHLRKSFRSTAAIQAAVNLAFEPVMKLDRQRAQAQYIALEESRKSPTDQPSVVVLPVAHPYNNWGYITKRQIEGQLPNATAAFVRWLLVDSGWQVADPASGERRGVEPEDVCILFRRYIAWRRDVTRDYTRALEVRGVSHVLVGERSFHQREEVETLRAVMTAIEWPEDELAVYSTLRGSLFSITDDALLRYRMGKADSLHPFSIPESPQLRDDPTLGPIVEALELLAGLHRRRNRRPIVETLQSVLEFTRAHAAFALRPAGNQVLANVQRVSDLARSYEVGGGGSFRGFVDRLNAEAERPTSNQAPVVEEGAAGVRLMTVHAAKGLEFPVVILADSTASLNRRSPERYVDAKAGLCAQSLLGWAPHELSSNADAELARDQAEGVRVAYVAATRARDLLVVPAVGDGEQDGWIEPLNKAIYPPSASRRKSEPAAGCPSFGEVSVVSRPQKFDGEPEHSIRPGLHRFSGSSHGVVWWDPALLTAEVDENLGLRQEEILAADAGDVEAGRGLEHYESWKEARRNLLQRGSRPSCEVVTVTGMELDRGPVDFSPEIVHASVERPVERSGGRTGRDRPRGERFGTLVHTVLRDIVLDADSQAVARLTQIHARTLGATSEEATFAAEAVRGALAHEVLVAARRAQSDRRCHRETPFVLPLDDGRLLEGEMDLTYRDEEGWVVVDFKTDADLDSRRERYEAQLSWYVFALGRIKGEPCRGVLLAV